ncbi:MAG TPA: pyridoxamine 5'-phosphate oxidase family protein [Actinocatenispora sp.]
MSTDARDTEPEPETELGAFSSPGAVPTAWAEGRAALRDAPLWWLSTVRPDHRPHVTPLIGVWLAGAAYFCTGREERKARNLAVNPSVVLTTGRADLTGLDVVLEGTAVPVHDRAELDRVAGTYEGKYGGRFTDPDGTWYGLADAMRAGDALVYRVVPATVFGFGKGHTYSQTRWRF